MKSPPFRSDSGPVLGAVVVNYNGRDHLGNCLEALCAAPPPGFFIIVADDASTDGSAELAEGFDGRGAPIAVARLPNNARFCRAANHGLRAALEKGADFVIVLNADTVAGPDCLATLLRFMEARPEAGACQPLVTCLTDPGRVASAGCRVGLTGRAWDDLAGHPVAEAAGPQGPDGPDGTRGPGGPGRPLDPISGRPARHVAGQPGTDAAPPPPRRVSGVTGAAMCLRAEALARVGLFDESLDMYFEDVDLCLRLYAAGYDSWLVPEARLGHVGGASSAGLGTLPIFWCERNALLVAASRFPPALALAALILGPASALVAAAWRLIHRQPGPALAILRGALSGLAGGPRRLARRLARRPAQSPAQRPAHSPAQRPDQRPDQRLTRTPRGRATAPDLPPGPPGSAWPANQDRSVRPLIDTWTIYPPPLRNDRPRGEQTVNSAAPAHPSNGRRP